MNSSIKTPSQNIQKFCFENDFSQEDELQRIELLRAEELNIAEEIVEEIPEEPPAPTFSEDEMQYARDVSFKNGYDKGVLETRQSIDNALVDLCGRIGVQLDAVAIQEAKHVHDAHALIVQTVLATMKKMWPKVMQQIGLETVTDTIRQSLDYNADEARVVVRVHADLVQAVENVLPQIQAEKAFTGKIIVAADADLQAGDCKIEWNDGGMERLSRDLSVRIEKAMDHIVALISKTDSNADTERTSQ